MVTLIVNHFAVVRQQVLTPSIAITSVRVSTRDIKPFIYLLDSRRVMDGLRLVLGDADRVVHQCTPR